jgi:hypothetical protein
MVALKTNSPTVTTKTSISAASAWHRIRMELLQTQIPR